MENALVVADDLTGAMDTGHGFAARGRGVRVRLRGDPDGTPDPATPGDVLAVDTDTRGAAPGVAAGAVERVVDTYPAARVYKKVDSTLRGNVTSEVDAAVAATGADLAVVAPAFPATGRTTEDAEHRVDGRPLAAAGYGVDESDLGTVFAASRYRVESLGLDTVDGGATAVREALAAVDAGRPALVVCDATTDAHLRAVANGAEGFLEATGATALFVGSGGLAKHVTVPGEPTPTAVGQASRPGTLAVVGSTNERTLVQLAAVPDELVVALDPAGAVRDPEGTGRRGGARLNRLLDRRDRAVVTAAASAGDVETAERAADEVGAAAGERVERALAAAAGGAVAGARPGSLVLTGGAVARATLARLGASELALTGRAVADGVPESVVASGPERGTRVVTKAGGFGTRRTILNCLDAL